MEVRKIFTNLILTVYIPYPRQKYRPLTSYKWYHDHFETLKPEQE